MDTLPLLTKCDTLIIGAGLAGLLAAEKQAYNGNKTLIIDSRIFPSYEVGAWHRPWLTVRQKNIAFLRDWFPSLPADAPDKSIFSFSLDSFKRSAEDRLLAAGANFLYAVQLVSLQKNANTFIATIGCKSGLYQIECKKIIDNTETGITQYSSTILPDTTFRFGSLYPGCSLCAEVKQAPTHESQWKLGKHHHLVDDTVLMHPSAFHSDNRILEMRFSKHMNNHEARQAMLQVCEELFATPAWSHAQFGTCSLTPMPMIEFDFAQSMLLGLDAHNALVQGANFITIWPATCPSPPFMPDKKTTSTNLFSTGNGYSFNISPIQPSLPSLSADISVCGSGPSGAVCAYTAGSEGLHVASSDINDEPGGTGTSGGVHYYWYGHRQGFTQSIDNEYEKLASRLHLAPEQYVWNDRDSWNPSLKATLFLAKFAQNNVQFLPNSFACAVSKQEDTVTGVLLATPWGPLSINATVTADCTGDADIARFAGLPLTEGSQKDAMTMWASLAQYKQAGTYRGGIFTTTVDVSSPIDYTRFILLNRRRGIHECYDHGTYVAPRESRHLQGEYIVDVADVVLNRQYPDTILTCFSNFDTKGKSWADIVYFGFLPSQIEINVPYRSLLAPHIDGLLVGGKALSATHDASSGIRMQDDMQNLGGAMGLACVLAVQSGGTRNFSITQLQQQLLQKGALSAAHLQSKTSLPTLQQTVAALTADEPFETIDMDMHAVCRKVSPIVQICLAPCDKVVPLLQQAYAKSESDDKKLLLARLLLWHRDETGIADIRTAIYSAFEREILPSRKGSVKFCQPYPDHGVMAEVSYLICLLARSQEDDVSAAILSTLAKRILSVKRDYTSRKACLFGHIESISYVSTRRGSTAFLPSLLSLVTLPEFEGIELYSQDFSDVDITKERIAYLKLLTGEALARCGSKKGYLILAKFLKDIRCSLAASAQRILADLLHLPNTSPSSIEQAVQNLAGYMPCQPYQTEIW